MKVAGQKHRETLPSGHTVEKEYRDPPTPAAQLEAARLSGKAQTGEAEREALTSMLLEGVYLMIKDMKFSKGDRWAARYEAILVTSAQKAMDIDLAADADSVQAIIDR